VLVVNLPGGAAAWPRIGRCWPDARAIVLLRHPAAILARWYRLQPRRPPERVVEDVRAQLVALDAVRREADTLTVRSEDVAAHLERELTRLCGFLGVDWDPVLLEDRSDPVDPEAILESWRDGIASALQPRADEVKPPGRTPAPLVELAQAWGYRR
jgi:hypothetical protein